MSDPAPRRRGRGRAAEGRDLEKTADGRSAVRHTRADGSFTATTAYKRYGAHVVERAQVDAQGQAREVATASRDGLLEKTVVTEKRSRRGLKSLDPREAGTDSALGVPGEDAPPVVRHVTRSVTDTTLASPKTRTLDNLVGYRQERALSTPTEVGLAPLETDVEPRDGAFHLAASETSVDNGIRVDNRDTAWKAQFGFVSGDGRATLAVQQAGCVRVGGRVVGCHLTSEQRGVPLEQACEGLLRDPWERARTESLFRQPCLVDLSSSSLWYYNPSEEAVHVTVRALATPGFPRETGRQVAITSGTPAGRPRRIFASAMLMEAAEGLRYRTEIIDCASPARLQMEARLGPGDLRLSLLVLDPHYATAVAEETRSRHAVQPHQVSDPRDPHNLQGDLRLISRFLTDLEGKPLLRESLRVTNRTGRGANHVLVTRFWSEGWAERLTLVSQTARGQRTDVTVLETPRSEVALAASASDGTRLSVDASNVFTLERDGQKASLPSLTRPSAGLRETVAGGGLPTLCRTLRRISQATADLPPFASQVLASFSVLPVVAGIVADDGPRGAQPALGVGYLSDAGSEAVRRSSASALLGEGQRLPAAMAAFALAGYGSYMNASDDLVYGVFNDGIGGSRFQEGLIRGGIGWGVAGVSIVGAPNYALWDLARA